MKKSNLLNKHLSELLLLVTLALSGTQAAAQEPQASQKQPSQNLVSISNAWVRDTHPGQTVGAAYMNLLSTQDLTLVDIKTNVAGRVEIHNMSIENGVMKMRMLEKLAITAGKPYQLAPGGAHFMLLSLKKPLATGEQINFILHFKLSHPSSKKVTDYKQSVKVTVQSSPEEGSHQAH